MTTPTSSTTQEIPTVTFELSQGTLKVPANKLPAHVQVLINAVQERRRTISYLNNLITGLTESNGADSALVQGALQEVAAANPEFVTPREDSSTDEVA
jgi:hypothetical protein